MITQHNFETAFDLFESEGSQAALNMSPEWAEGFVQTLKYAQLNCESPETGANLQLQEVQIKFLQHANTIFKDHLENVSDQYARATGQRSPRGEEPEFSEHEQTVQWGWSEACGRGCCSDYYTLTMPLHILWTPQNEWQTEYQAEQKRKADTEADKKAKEKHEREVASAIAQETRDKADYARLKAKFEQENSS